MKITNEPHKEISVVIPAYNEQANIPILVNRIAEVLEPLGREFEVIIVDDGSSDGTLQVLAEQKKSRPWLRVIALDRHCGQTCAMAAGFQGCTWRYYCDHRCRSSKRSSRNTTSVDRCLMTAMRSPAGG